MRLLTIERRSGARGVMCVWINRTPYIGSDKFRQGYAL